MADLEDVTLDGRPLQSLRVADLKAALEERGLSKSGQKNALVKRLKGALMLENLQKTSTAHVGLQPNSQIGEEMSQNSFIKQYLAKQQELLRQRLEREAREAYETNDQEDHTDVNNSLCPPQVPDASTAMTDHFKPPGTSSGQAVPTGLSHRHQEAAMSRPPASASVAQDRFEAAGDSDEEESEDGDDDGDGDDDDDWDNNIQRRLPRQPVRAPMARERSAASCQPQQQHIPSVLSPQLRQPTPPPSPPPELSFPLPDTPKQSPPSPDVAAGGRSPSSSSSGSSSSGSRSSSPEPPSGHADRKPGPLTLLARKMESEGAFSGAEWHRDANRQGNCSSSTFPNKVRPEGLMSSVPHMLTATHAPINLGAAQGHAQVPVLKATAERDAELEREKSLELQRQAQQRKHEQERAMEEERVRAALEREQQKAMEKEQFEREQALERERQERELILAREREEKEQALALERQRALERELALQREREERERRQKEEQEKAMELERARILERERALEQERLERERALEAERIERERMEREKALEQERLERERLEQEKLEREAALERERLEKEKERMEREKALEQERIERERVEKARALERERIEREKALEQERIEREKALEQERLERKRALEQERIEREKALEQERIEREKALEQERIEREKVLERERLEREKAQIEQARLERERALELERIEREKALEQERIEREKALEQERIEREKALEQERLEREKALERERIEREKALEQERIEREKAQIEQERIKRERALEQERIEQEKLEREKTLERERIEKERAQEQERIEREKALEREKIEKERLELEKALERERIEKERNERENMERERLELEQREKRRALEQQRLALEKQENERIAKERALEQERIERVKAIEQKEKAEREAALEREQVEKAEQERLELEKAQELKRQVLEEERKAKENALLTERQRSAEQVSVEKKQTAHERANESRMADVESEDHLTPSRGCEIGFVPLPTPPPLSTGTSRKASTEAGKQEGEVHGPVTCEGQAEESNTPKSPQPVFKKFRFTRETPLQPQAASRIIKRPRAFSDTSQPCASVMSAINADGQRQKEQSTDLESAGGQFIPDVKQVEAVESAKKENSINFMSESKEELGKNEAAVKKSVLTAVEDGTVCPSSQVIASGRGRNVKKTEKKDSRRSSSNDSSSSESDSASSSSPSTDSSSSSREKTYAPQLSRDEENASQSIEFAKAQKTRFPAKLEISSANTQVNEGLHTKQKEASSRDDPQTRKGSEDDEEKPENSCDGESSVSEPEKGTEANNEIPKAFSTRKISLSSSKSSPGSTENEHEGTAGGRKRRWGSSTAVTAKKPSISITTDSLKSLIPDIRPALNQDAVMELHPEDPVLSETEEEEKDHADQELQIRRTVTQIVHVENQEDGQKEAKRRRDESEEEDALDEKETKICDEDPTYTRAIETPSPLHTSHEADINSVAQGDILIRRSINQQKTGVSITIDDPVRTARQPSPPRGNVSNIVHICNLVRPFTLGQLKELLGRTGNLVEDGFWIDKIKSHCYVTYSSSEEAVATRAALHGVKWPQSNPKVLSVDFCQQDELDFHKGLGSGDRAGIGMQSHGRNLPSLLPERDQWMEREREMERRERARAEREWDRDKVREFGKTPEQKEPGARRSRSRERRRKEREKSKEKKTEKKEKPEDPPAKLLDDLFRKTKAVPCIYWLPLTEEQYIQREAARVERRKEREMQRKKEEEEAELKKKEENKERMKPGGGLTVDRSESEKIRDRDRARERGREREREREADKRRDGYRRPGVGAGPGGRRSRSRSDPRERRR